MTQSHYNVLDVPRDADAGTIKKAYRKKASKAHSDRKGGDHALMVAVNRAYDTLSDPEKRKRYDETGRDEPPPVSEESQATEMLMQVFVQVAEQADETVDLIAAVRRELEKALGQMEAQRTDLQRKVKKLEAHRKRLKRIRGEGNPLDGVLEQRIRHMRQGVAELPQVIARAKRAIDLAATYRYETQEASRGFQFVTWSVAS